MAAGLLAFFIALFASLALVVPVRALALRVGMVDLPGPRKVHLKPIPLLGGLAMYAAVVIAVLFAFNGPARAQIVGILIGATLVAAHAGEMISELRLRSLRRCRSRRWPRRSTATRRRRRCSSASPSSTPKPNRPRRPARQLPTTVEKLS